MGEVYKAKDTRPGATSRQGAAGDAVLVGDAAPAPDREAKTIRPSHPTSAPSTSAERHRLPRHGSFSRATLADRLGKGALDDQALRIAIEIAQPDARTAWDHPPGSRPATSC
jgi:hypothetical protein